MLQDAAVDVAAPASAPVAAPASAPVAEPSAVAIPTTQKDTKEINADLKDTVLELADYDRKYKQQTLDILQSLNATSIPTLAPDLYPAFIEKMQNLLKNEQ
jgi:hypothetical protein